MLGHDEVGQIFHMNDPQHLPANHNDLRKGRAKTVRRLLVIFFISLSICFASWMSVFLITGGDRDFEGLVALGFLVAALGVGASGILLLIIAPAQFKRPRPPGRRE